MRLITLSLLATILVACQSSESGLAPEVLDAYWRHERAPR